MIVTVPMSVALSLAGFLRKVNHRTILINLKSHYVFVTEPYYNVFSLILLKGKTLF